MSAPQIAPSPLPRILKSVGWVVMTFLALLMFLMAGRYLTLNPELYFSEQRAIYEAHTIAIIAHIAGAMLATIIGPFQFLPKIRSGKFFKVHRWLGRTYLVGVLCGGLAGLYMATMAYGGWIARVGFALLAILWLFSGFMAFKHIRNMQTELHRQWMIRNYALTFAAVTLRLWNGLFQAVGVDFVTGYIIVAWLCWIPNLLVAEWIVGRMRRRQPRPTMVSTTG